MIKGTGYEDVPGPLDCKCSKCESKTEQERMLAALKVPSESVRKYNGVIFYRTWMTWALQDREYKLFAGLSGKLPKNVFLISKIGYGDFGVEEIPHPLFGHIQPRSQHIAGFQIFGEYRGLHYNACEMVTHWGEWLRINNKDFVGGFIGDIEVDRDIFDHPLNMVNWYAFGRFACEPDAKPDEIIAEWAEATYGKDAVDVVSDVVKRTSVATMKMMYFKGVWIQNHSWLPTLNYLDTHLRGPWVDMKRDEKLIGWGRSLNLFPPDQSAKYAADPDFELFLERKEINPKILEELLRQQSEAVADYESMLARWRQGRGLMDERQYSSVEHLLSANVSDAKIWRLNTQAFISYLLGKDFEPFVREMECIACR